jgi:hypothetical protein
MLRNTSSFVTRSLKNASAFKPFHAMVRQTFCPCFVLESAWLTQAGVLHRPEAWLGPTTSKLTLQAGYPG